MGSEMCIRDRSELVCPVGKRDAVRYGHKLGRVKDDCVGTSLFVHEHKLGGRQHAFVCHNPEETFFLAPPQSSDAVYWFTTFGLSLATRCRYGRVEILLGRLSSLCLQDLVPPS